MAECVGGVGDDVNLLTGELGVVVTVVVVKLNGWCGAVFFVR